MTHRSNTNSNINVSSTDVLIAMLTGDLRGSWAERTALPRREHVDPAGSGSLPAITDTAADAEACTAAGAEAARAAAEPEAPEASAG